MPRFSSNPLMKEAMAAAAGNSNAKSKNDLVPVRIPMIGSSYSRGTAASKDQRFVNGYFDFVDNPISGAKKSFFVKRPGLSLHQVPPGGASGEGRGIKRWNGDLYTVIGTKIYKNTTDLGVTLTTSTGLVGMEFTRPSAGTPYLCVNDGVKLYAINAAGTVTTVTTNFPTPNTTDLVYMDGYLFVMKTDGTIWCCDFDDPITWDPTKFITAQMYPGSGVGIAHQNNLLVAFSDQHIQCFYDAANATGSPLSNVEQAVQQIGCASNNSIVQDESYVTFVSRAQDGGYSVFRLEGTNLKNISFPGLDRILTGEGSSISSAFAYSIRHAGHFFYILNLTSSSRTFVYDHDLDLWVEWSDFNSAMFGTMIKTVTETSDNKLVGIHPGNQTVYQITESSGTDAGNNFTVLGRLARLDFDDTSRKFVQQAELIGDVQASTTNVSLQYSDDDWATLSTARTLDMSQVRPFATRFGNFRRRAWQFSYTGSNPLRIEALQFKVRMAVNG